MKPKWHFTIVDDDAHMLYFFEHALSGVFPESEITRFDDGTEALDFIRREGADLLVTDHRMARMSGADLIRELRALGFNLPIIMVSSSPDAQAEGAAAGATVFITKENVLKRLPSIASDLLEVGLPSRAR